MRVFNRKSERRDGVGCQKGVKRTLIVTTVELRVSPYKKCVVTTPTQAYVYWINTENSSSPSVQNKRSFILVFA